MYIYLKFDNKTYLNIKKEVVVGEPNVVHKREEGECNLNVQGRSNLPVSTESGTLDLPPSFRQRGEMTPCYFVSIKPTSDLLIPL